jgi:hypothetical protein
MMRQRTCVRAALLCALTAVAAVPATAGAAPRHDDGLTIAATPNPIVAGTGVLIYGQLHGSDVADQTVYLYHRIAPATKFTIISKTTTNQNGYYEFTRADGVVITNRDWYVVGPNAAHSRTIDEHVSSTLTLGESASATTTGQKVLFSGTASPAHANEKVLIQIQDSTTGSGWRTVATGRTNAASAYDIAHAFRDGGDYTLRAVLPGDARNIAGSSDASTLEVQQTQNPSFTINSSAPAITVGAGATVSGTLYAIGSTTTPAASVPVELYARGVNGAFQAVASSTTASDGSYSFTEAPVNNTVYKVETTASPVQRTASLYEAVAETVSLTPSATSTTVGTDVSFSGVVSPDHTGHTIYLQVETPKGGWQDVAASSITSGSRYSINYRFGQPSTFTVRARIFGGPENVGAGSTPVTVTVAGDAAASSLPAAS